MWIHNINIMSYDNGYGVYVKAICQQREGEPPLYPETEQRRVCLDWAGVEEYITEVIAELNPKDMEEEHGTHQLG